MTRLQNEQNARGATHALLALYADHAKIRHCDAATRCDINTAHHACRRQLPSCRPGILVRRCWLSNRSRWDMDKRRWWAQSACRFHGITYSHCSQNKQRRSRHRWRSSGYVAVRGAVPVECAFRMAAGCLMAAISACAAAHALLVF
jgi:hypothetical protein